MDFETTFRSLDQMAGRLDRPDSNLPTGSGAPVFVGRITTPQSQIAAQRYLKVNPASVLGAEVEGGAGSVTTDTTTSVPVYLIGPGVAKTGELLVCRFVDFRWVAERMTTHTTSDVIVTGCPCSGGSAGTTPSVLHMHATNPEYNFNNLRTCTLVYQQTPPEYVPLAIGANNHFSQESFNDSLTGESFRYLFRCELGSYVVRKIYAVSAAGSPSMTIVLYQWLVGFPGNHCGFPGNPFLLSNGRIHQTGDTRTVVTVNTVAG